VHVQETAIGGQLDIHRSFSFDVEKTAEIGVSGFLCFSEASFDAQGEPRDSLYT
jgi:hypothetical protein